jgi:ketosteroid isomerase-like protein
VVFLIAVAACSATSTESRTMEHETNTVERTLSAFDAAWARGDLEGILQLFAEDASLESPLVPRLLNRSDGVLRGRDEIREMIRALLQRGKPWGKHEKPIIQGNRAAIEFRSAPSEGEQFYSVDIIEVKDDKIQSLRAYSGWRPLAAPKP